MSQFSSEIAVKHSQYLWTAKWFFSSSLWIPGIQFLASKSSANTKIHIANNSSYHTPWRQEVTLVLTEDDLSSRLFFQQPSIFSKVYTIWQFLANKETFQKLENIFLKIQYIYQTLKRLPLKYFYCFCQNLKPQQTSAKTDSTTFSRNNLVSTNAPFSPLSLMYFLIQCWTNFLLMLVNYTLKFFDWINCRWTCYRICNKR